jgi:ABC-2 type transport system permease protein
MKRFASFVKKELFHILRDRRSLLILLGMPVVQVILFGFAITNEINDARIAILDPSRDQMSRDITQRLVSSGYFILDGNMEQPRQIEKRFQEGKIKLAVVFPPGLQEKFYRDPPAAIQLIADASDPNTATLLTNYATAIIQDYQREKLRLDRPPMNIRTEVKMLYNPRLKSVFMFVPGVMTVLLMLVSAMMTSIAITREKELGTMEVLLASPLKPALIIVGKVAPYVILGLIETVIILMLGAFVFGMPVEGSLALLMAECLLFVITALALGIFISTRTDSQQIAMMFSLMGLMLPTILLSGFIFPIESMPMALQLLSNIIPAKWFIIILKNIMLKGVGFEFIWKETLILMLMTLFFIGVSVKNFKIRLE